jgi:mRNA interferase RelE/StbE
VPWRSQITKPAQRQFNRLPLPVQERIRAKLHTVALDPIRYIRSFNGEFYKLRVGDYRALVELQFRTQTIIVHVVGHRKDVYHH